jgi:hypothetical protein
VGWLLEGGVCLTLPGGGLADVEVVPSLNAGEVESDIGVLSLVDGLPIGDLVGALISPARSPIGMRKVIVSRG